MIKHVGRGLLAGIMLTITATAQTDIASLEAVLKNKSMWLRSYSADRVARYQWSNGVLATAPDLHAIGDFTAKSVKLKRGKLVIEGERTTLVRDIANNKAILTGKAPMRLEVDLQGADPAVVIPHLQDEMFFPNAQSAVNGEPASVANLLPFDISRSRQPTLPHSVFINGQWLEVSEPAKLVQPQIVSSAFPDYTDEAREARINGRVQLIFFVSKAGQIENVWLAKPLGYGLDERAFAALKQFVFKPSTYENNPVGITLQVEIAFEIR